MIYLEVLTLFSKSGSSINCMVKGLLEIIVVWSLDQTYPLSETILSNEEDMRKCNHWIKLRSMYNTGINSTKAKIIQHLYLL